MYSQAIDDSVGMHTDILDALDQGDKLNAMKSLYANWDLSISSIINVYQNTKS